MGIELDYSKNSDLFDGVARHWAEKIENGTKKTQVRNFYDKVLELEQKAEVDDFQLVLPFVKMLNSKVAYGLSRKVVNQEFKNMIEMCVQQILCKEDLKRFKLFFEAVIGFYKGRD